MWVAKFVFSGVTAQIGSMTCKHKVNIFGYPLAFKYGEGGIIVNVAGKVLGPKENIENFYKDIQKQSRIINVELNEDFFIGTIEEPAILKEIYTHKVFHLAPVLIDENADETFTIAAFKKETLEHAIKSVQKLHKVKLIYLKNKKVNNISMFSEIPVLTEKQKSALNLAIKRGYYKVPRETELIILAKEFGVSYSTYQVHLRKAESKLMPYSYNSIK